MAVTWSNGYKLEIVRIGDLHPNPWNPNEESPEIFEKVKRSMLENGVVEPPQIRELEDGTKEIVNGEHRWRAASELWGDDAGIPVINLGSISDQQAKKLTIITNELRGQPEPVKLAAVLKELAELSTLDDLALDLPMSVVEMDSLIGSLKPYDWNQIENGLPTAQSAPTQKQLNTGARKIQLGNIKGDIAVNLHDALVVEFERSARAVGSTNVETVMRDWLQRLVDTAQATEERIAALPVPAVKAPKRRTKKTEAAS